MKEKMIFIGSILLISNIAFASTSMELVAQQERNTLKANPSQTQQAVVAELSARGLDTEVAVEKASHFLQNNVDVMVANLTKSISDVSTKNVESYLANKALFNTECSLDNYGNLVAMVQDIKQIALSDEVLNTLASVSSINAQLV